MVTETMFAESEEMAMETSSVEETSGLRSWPPKSHDGLGVTGTVSSKMHPQCTCPKFRVLHFTLFSLKIQLL
jgi:hypothetical protein